MSKLSELDVDKYVEECVDIDPDISHINDEFIKLPAQLAYWNAEHSRVLRKELKAAFNVKRVHAQRALILREELISDKGKATESMVEHAVNVDEEYKIAYLLHVEARAEKAEIAGWVEAIKAKKDALVTIGANQRAEMREPSINTEESPWK